MELLPAAPVARDRRLFAIGLAIGAFFMFAVLDVCAKNLRMAGFDPVSVIWVRFFGHFLLAAMLLRRRNLFNVWRSKRPGLQVLRGCLLLGGTTCNFIAVRYLQLAETGAIAFAIPLIIAVLAVPILGERIGPRRWAAILVGFLGVLVVVRPGPEIFQSAALIAVGTTLFAATYMLVTRIVAQVDHPETSNMYAGIVGAVLTTPLVPFFWTTPSGIEWLPFLLIGVMGMAGHLLISIAHEHAPAPIIAPFWYTQIVWMIGFGFLVFGDVPDIWTLAGAAIVLSSGLYVWYRERVRKGDVLPP